MNSSNIYAKIGTICYVIWGILHLQAAHAVYVLGRSMDFSMAQGRVYQDAWNLLFFAIIAIVVAVALNWRNSSWGYWINFFAVGIADTGFIFFVVVPGHMGIWPGILGPVFWILGLIFLSIALVSRSKGLGGSLADHATTLNQTR
jgi:hypothetical protein